MELHYLVIPISILYIKISKSILKKSLFILLHPEFNIYPAVASLTLTKEARSKNRLCFRHTHFIKKILHSFKFIIYLTLPDLTTSSY
jgi:hypothetical protein